MYRQRGTPRWAWFIYFLVVLTGAVWFYFKAPGYSRPGSSCSSCSPGSSCSKQPQQQPAKPELPKIIRVF